MHLIKALSSLALSVVMITATAAEQPTEAAAKQADKARFDAVVKRDAAALERLLADDLVYCHSGGNCEGKRSYIDSIKAGKLRYESVTTDESTVILLDDVAIVNGQATAMVAVGDDPVSRVPLGYTDVFVWRDGRWQMISWRSVALKK